MKVLFCNNVLTGLLQFRKDVINDFYARGWDIVIVVPKESINATVIAKLNKSWKIYQPDVRRNSISPLSDLRFMHELYKIYKIEKPDIIFHYTVKPNIYGTFAANLLGIRNVAMVAGLGYLFNGNSVKKKIGRTLYKLALRSADKVFVLNSSNRQVLEDGNYVRPEKLILLEGGEGVNTDLYPYQQMLFADIRFLMIARVLYDKGYSEYVEAAKIVKRKYPDIAIELLGPLDTDSPMGVPESVVMADVKNGAINYLGATNNVQDYLLRDGVVVVLPSKYLEGLNRSLMEACSMGRPIITTTNAGCRETVDDGVNGYLIPPADAVALADAMIRFIENSRQNMIKMSEASHRKAIEIFDVKNVINVYQLITNELISKNK